MKVLVIGSGGREHALDWCLAKSPEVKQVYGSPGNPGIAKLGKCIQPRDSSPQAMLEVAEALDIDLTVVGPEAPLVEGIVDLFRQAKRAIIGPSASAARLEGSKIYAKQFFRRASIPTAEFVTVENHEQARSALERFAFPVVLKADGLAAGKGVVVARDRKEFEDALPRLGARLVVEEFLTGEEVSFIVLSDGRNIVPLAPTQDHKAAYDGDRGPNTGGMGAYCDSGILTDRESALILERIIAPAVEATQFTGFLYAGLMMTREGPKLLEFNVRLGDPEAQALMHRLDCDFASVLLAAVHGQLAGTTLRWKPEPSVCVVLASAGYPGAYQTGFPISGIEEAEAGGATVFHAGTHAGPNGLETSGGRVLGVTASGSDLASAIANTYTAVRKIRFEKMHYRTDIGQKGLKRYSKGVSGT